MNKLIGKKRFNKFCKKNGIFFNEISNNAVELLNEYLLDYAIDLIGKAYDVYDLTGAKRLTERILSTAKRRLRNEESEMIHYERTIDRMEKNIRSLEEDKKLIRSRLKTAQKLVDGLSAKLTNEGIPFDETKMI